MYWLAENSDVGRKMIEQMFLSPDLHFLDIEVLTYRKVLKADSTHFDNYCHRPHRDMQFHTGKGLRQMTVLNGNTSLTDRCEPQFKVRSIVHV